MDAKPRSKQDSEAGTARIEAGLPDEQTIGWLSDFFGVFADNTRLRMLYFLSRGELRVAELAGLVGLQQSAVSHQLKILRLHRLVKSRREGTTIHYSLDDEHVQQVLAIALSHVSEGRGG